MESWYSLKYFIISANIAFLGEFDVVNIDILTIFPSHFFCIHQYSLQYRFEVRY